MPALAKHWQAGNRTRASKPTLLGQLALLIFIGWCLYNLYSLVTTGRIYGQHHRVMNWIAFSEDEASFSISLFIYALPFVLLLGFCAGSILTRRQHRLAAWRQFSNGTGPAPIRRPVKER